MTTTYILTTALKTKDAVAATAAYTLIHDMGYQHIVTGIQREEFWRIGLSSGRELPDPEAIMHELAQNTRVFVNPNKHRYAVRKDGTIHSEANPDQSGLFSIKVLVTGIENRSGEVALNTLKALYDIGKRVETIENGILWTIDLKASGMGEARKTAETIAVTRSRQEGLLANPHYESIQIL